MAKLFLVSYDLRAPGKNYDDLIKALRALPEATQCLLSAWLVHTDDTAASIYGILRPHIDANDQLLITQVQGERTGSMPSYSWDWLTARGH